MCSCLRALVFVLVSACVSFGVSDLLHGDFETRRERECVSKRKSKFVPLKATSERAPRFGACASLRVWCVCACVLVSACVVSDPRVCTIYFCVF